VTQLDLLEPGQDAIGKFHGPDHGAPETQRAAAISEYPRTGTKRLAVLSAVAAADGRGLTDEEGFAITGFTQNTYRPRRVELVDGGWVADTGIRRRVLSGKPAVAWVLTEKGEQWVAR